MKFHPLVAQTHHHVASTAKLYSPTKILDMGGTIKLPHFVSCKVVNANIVDGIDATKLPFKASQFDVTVSIATLEHVGKQNKFLSEAVRVAKKATIHWFLYGDWAVEVEKLKSKLGHKHKCKIPNKAVIERFKENPKLKATGFFPVVTCGEHLLLLAAKFNRMNRSEIYNFVEKWGDRPYGYLLTGEK
jgi:hypothetical protein